MKKKRKGALKNFENSLKSFFNKLAGTKPATLLERESNTSVFT